MTVLQALDGYYERMAARNEVVPPGFSAEKISYAIELSERGEVVGVRDLRVTSGKKTVPATIAVPAGTKRTVAIVPNRLWDKTAYTLGRTAGEGRRTADEHAVFRATHLQLLAGTEDPGLLALRRFIESWTPDRFDAAPFAPEMLDANFVFRLDGDQGFIHDRPAAHALLAAQGSSTAAEVFCLVTGMKAAPTRLHPTIKGVDGAQTAGAALVSFNLEAFGSYGKEQGANAPTSEAAAFRYGAALNRLLDRQASRNRIKIGDTTVVFWADASGVGEGAAQAAEDNFLLMLGEGGAATEDADEAARIGDVLRLVASGRPVASVVPAVQPGTRFYVLGLAPNAARLSVRFWLVDTFDAFAERLALHHADLAILPSPWRNAMPAMRWLLAKTTALQEKFENIPPLLVGEVMRAILGGGRYPQSLLAAAIGRLRAGDDAASGWHAAVIKASLARDHRLLKKKEAPVALDRDDPNPAYQLGRLFAAVETAQRMALGQVNATIRDRYFGAASATPASVFPLLMRGVQNHLGKLRKERKGFWLEREIEEIHSHLPSTLPRSLKLEAQGRFVLGYYHQRRGQQASREVATEIEITENREVSDDEQ